MIHFFKKHRRMLCLCLFLVCSVFIVNTKVVHADEIIYQPNELHQKGIWISNLNGHNTRLLFNPPIVAKQIAIQDGDRYILCVGIGIGIEDGTDVYLFDTKNVDRGRKDLTYGQFSTVRDAAISVNGDVVFSNVINNEFPDGIYLIPNEEIHETFPKAEKLFDGAANYVDWAPNGQEIVFSNNNGIFLLNVDTKKVSQILDYGYRPVFSPDGSKLAFVVPGPLQNKGKRTRKIGMISLNDPKDEKVFETTKTDLYCNYLTWTPDGKSISYVLAEVKGILLWALLLDYTNFVVSITEGRPGRPKQILQHIEGGVRALEWTQKAYSVEPESKLTTTWGQLKRDTKNGGNHE